MILDLILNWVWAIDPAIKALIAASPYIAGGLATLTGSKWLYDHKDDVANAAQGVSDRIGEAFNPANWGRSLQYTPTAEEMELYQSLVKPKLSQEEFDNLANYVSQKSTSPVVRYVETEEPTVTVYLSKRNKGRRRKAQSKPVRNPSADDQSQNPPLTDITNKDDDIELNPEHKITTRSNTTESTRITDSPLLPQDEENNDEEDSKLEDNKPKTEAKPDKKPTLRERTGEKVGEWVKRKISGKPKEPKEPKKSINWKKVGIRAGAVGVVGGGALDLYRTSDGRSPMMHAVETIATMTGNPNVDRHFEKDRLYEYITPWNSELNDSTKRKKYPRAFPNTQQLIDSVAPVTPVDIKDSDSAYSEAIKNYDYSD